MTRRALVVDGQHLTWRCYYAIPYLSAWDGTPTNAVFGFLHALKETIELFKPSRVIVCWDGDRQKLWRRQVWPGYKGNREADGLKANRSLVFIQMNMIKKALGDVLAIPQLEREEFEGDDFVAWAAWKAREEGFKPVVMSSDHDFLQLVDEDVTVYDGMKKIWVDLGNFAEVAEQPDPLTYLDMMIINGDSGDDVPAVKGLSGEKRFEKWAAHLSDCHLPLILGDEDAFERRLCPELREKFLPRFAELHRNWELVDLMFGAARLSRTKWPQVPSPFEKRRLLELATNLSMRSIVLEFDSWVRAFEVYHERAAS